MLTNYFQPHKKESFPRIKLEKASKRGKIRLEEIRDRLTAIARAFREHGSAEGQMGHSEFVSIA